MRLYLAKGRYVGTQAEARKIDKSFEQVEVPTDKEGLIAYLNGWCNVPIGEVTPFYADDGRLGTFTYVPVIKELSEHITHNLANDPRETPAAERLAHAARSISIEEEIANADFPTALRLAEHATSRVGECLREIADSRFPQPRKGYSA